MAGQANSLISHGSLVGTIKTSNAATNSLVGRLNVDNTITGRMDTSSLTGALDTDNAITSQSGSISTDDQMVGVLNANNTIAGGVGTAYNPAYALVDEAAAQIVLYINNTDYKFYAELKDKNGSHIANSNIIDLPLESMVVNGSYDSTNKEIVLTLNNGNTLRFSVADLVSGLVSTTDLSTVLLNYVEFTDYANGTNAGVIKTSSSYATETSDGVLRAQNKTYTQYESLSNNAFISKGTLDNAITGKELTNKTYVDNADKVFEDDLFNSGYVTSEGTSMSLDAKIGKPEIELKGNTIQTSTPTPTSPQPINVVSGRQEVNVVGKNLFDKDNANILQVNLNNSTTISGNNTSNRTLYIPIQPNTTYTISKIISNYFVIGTTESLPQRNLAYYQRQDNASANSLTITTNSTAKYLICWFWNSSDTLTEQQILDSIQIEKGSTASEYEEFKGQTYEINLGKNLVDTLNSTPVTTGILTNTINSDSSISVSGTPTSANNNILNQTNFATPLESGSYTFSISKTLPFNIRLRLYYTDGTSVEGTINNGNLSVPISPTQQVSSWRLWGSSFTTGTEVNETFFIQLEKGKISTSIVPYKTPIYLGEIGTYQDYIFKNSPLSPLYDSNLEEGQWYIHKEIGRYNEWSSVNRTTAFTNTTAYQFVLPIPTDSSKRAYAKSNYFQNHIDNNDTEHFYIGTSTPNVYSGLNVFISNSRVSTSAEAITWLKNNGVEVYYALNTPTTTEITDTELISQLNAIELLEGLNNISITSGDLPGIIKIKAFSNTTAGSITRLEKIVEFLGDSIGDIGTLLDEIQGEVI